MRWIGRLGVRVRAVHIYISWSRDSVVVRRLFAAGPAVALTGRFHSVDWRRCDKEVNRQLCSYGKLSFRSRYP